MPHIKHHRRNFIILDNASIHKSRRFQRMIRRAGGVVHYTPPYAYDRTPLDNGTFGIVKRYLQRHGQAISRRDIRYGLDKAFRRIGERAARYCFRNCGYHEMR